ncbi:MAG: glutamate-binding protein [Acidimicrobiales bacterium]|nr:MAG: glutamate-binding protein [Acidimicrobiales bacterium]
MRKGRYGAALAALAAVAVLLTACSTKKDSSVVERAKENNKLTIGVKFDQPGIGLKKPDGSVEGFDIDVATYIAKQLGVDAKNIAWKETRSVNRESFLQNGNVDLAVASYTINPNRKKKVGFAGPYYIAHQDIMVRSNDNSIQSFADLKGKRLCQVAGSNSWENITRGTNKLNQKQDVVLFPANSYDECMTKLRGKSVDVVSTDDVILAGFAARDPQNFKVVGAPFTDEKYGVGMKKGDKKSCEAVNMAIKKMYEDGSAQRFLEKNFGAAKFKYADTLPAFEPCS